MKVVEVRHPDTNKLISKARILEGFEDLTPSLLKKIAKIVFENKSDVETKFNMLEKVCGFNKLALYRYENSLELCADYMNDMDFLFENNGNPEFFIKRFGLLIGPHKGFSGVTFDEFGFAYEHFKTYMETKDEVLINYLIGGLFRFPFTKFKRKKIPFYAFLAKYFVRKSTKQAFVLNFKWVFDYFFERWFYLKIAPKGNSKKDFENLILSTSAGAFGDFEKTKNSDVTIVFKYLEDLEEKRFKSSKKTKQ